jgi:hypothetical protein
VLRRKHVFIPSILISGFVFYKACCLTCKALLDYYFFCIMRGYQLFLWVWNLVSVWEQGSEKNIWT